MAREVKTLASQTVKATEDIRRQISGIQAATRTAVGAVDSIGNEIRELSQLTGVMRTSIDSQYEATRDIATFANSAREASAGLTERMKSVDDAIQANSLAGSCIQDSTMQLANKLAALSQETQVLLEKEALIA